MLVEERDVVVPDSNLEQTETNGLFRGINEFYSPISCANFKQWNQRVNAFVFCTFSSLVL